jgi:hypothetical protein
MSDSFYVTLHSDSVSHVNFENRPDHFKIHLGQVLHFEGRWEVGIVEMFYPMTLKSIMFAESAIMIESKKEKKVNNNLKLENHQNGNAVNEYANDIKHERHIIDINPDQVMLPNDNVGLVARIQESLLILANIRTIYDNGIISFHLNSLLDTNEEIKFYMHTTMQSVLGLDLTVFDTSHPLYGSRKVNVHRALPQLLFVYTDIIHHQLIGTAYDKLLRVVTIDANSYQFGCTRGVTFSRIQYYPVAKQKIDVIDINIKDGNKENVSFHYGTLTVVLHFRKLADV